MTSTWTTSGCVPYLTNRQVALLAAAQHFEGRGASLDITLRAAAKFEKWLERQDDQKRPTQL